MADRYGRDVLAAPDPRRRPAPQLDLQAGLVVEEASGEGFCGAVVGYDRATVTLEDRQGRRRVFPLLAAGFRFEGALVTLCYPPPAPAGAPARTASGSLAVTGTRARVARASRILVEGRHDAELVERIWGEDLRQEGVVVEMLDGAMHLPFVVDTFHPGPGRRLAVLLDHLVPGSKESRIAAQVRHPDVLVGGHPYVDVWAAVRPGVLGLAAWPQIPPGQPWKEGVCAALGVEEPAAFWRRLLARVTGYADVEVALLRAVEELIDFVTG